MPKRSKFNLADLPPAPDLTFETDLWQRGFHYLAGIDEAGRGALAGPVYAAAVILPSTHADLLVALQGVNDSKKLTPAQRAHWAAQIPRVAVTWAIASASAAEIDQHGILPATHLAALRALQALMPAPEALLLDYLTLPSISLPQTPLIKGDARSLSIAAASILAKTARDAHLNSLEQEYPGYGFSKHKGYGTPQHLAALAALGPSLVHRRTFAPLQPRLF
ncbi:MAG TPA: ribonuclease HII [Anaerolineales bacterium]|nr:ribonuclease HII [Anaerolineales bacterium]